MEAQGKWAVIGVLGTALVLASFGWWWNLQRSKRCLEFWGPTAATTIRQGEQVAAFQLSAEPVVQDNQADEIQPSDIVDTKLKFPAGLSPAAKKDISQVPGLIHARNSLLDDASFVWDQSPPPKPVWTHALYFQSDASHEVVLVLFDLKQFCIQHADHDRILPLVKQSQDAWRIAFGARYFEDPALLPPPK